jgi:hypothetical protein
MVLFRKFSIGLTIQSCKNKPYVSNDLHAELEKSSTYSYTWLGFSQGFSCHWFIFILYLCLALWTSQVSQEPGECNPQNGLKLSLKILINTMNLKLSWTVEYMYVFYSTITSSTLHYTLKTKTWKKNKFRSSTVMVLKMFFFGIKNVLNLKEMFFFQEQIMICAWKSNIFYTFTVLELNTNEKKNSFSKSVEYFDWSTLYYIDFYTW